MTWIYERFEDSEVASISLNLHKQKEKTLFLLAT